MDTSNIINLSTLDRKSRRKAERTQKKLLPRAKSPAFEVKPEFVQVCATTIGQFLQVLQWSMTIKVDTEYFQFLGDACNYQLQCFARAYGLPYEETEDIPVRFEMEFTLDAEAKKTIFDFTVSGDMGGDVAVILEAANPELETIEPSSDGQ